MSFTDSRCETGERLALEPCDEMTYLIKSSTPVALQINTVLICDISFVLPILSNDNQCQMLSNLSSQLNEALVQIFVGFETLLPEYLLDLPPDECETLKRLQYYLPKSVSKSRLMIQTLQVASTKLEHLLACLHKEQGIENSLAFISSQLKNTEHKILELERRKTCTLQDLASQHKIKKILDQDLSRAERNRQNLFDGLHSPDACGCSICSMDLERLTEFIDSLYHQKVGVECCIEELNENLEQNIKEIELHSLNVAKMGLISKLSSLGLSRDLIEFATDIFLPVQKYLVTARFVLHNIHTSFELCSKKVKSATLSPRCAILSTRGLFSTFCIIALSRPSSCSELWQVRLKSAYRFIFANPELESLEQCALYC